MKEYSPRFLNDAQISLITEIAEIIVPETDTPGAKEAGVPCFIDRILCECYGEDQRDRFLEGLDLFDRHARIFGRDSFIDCSPQQKLAMIKQFSQMIHSRQKTPEGSMLFFVMVRELTLLAYYTTEVGAGQVSQYSPCRVSLSGVLHPESLHQHS